MVNILEDSSRLHQFIKLYLFAPSSAVFGCPLAMTDGAARLLELWGSKEEVEGLELKVNLSYGQWRTLFESDLQRSLKVLDLWTMGINFFFR